jgi:hypothetical protein
VAGETYRVDPGGYVYLRPSANAEDAALGRSGGALVEEDYGEGTAGAHWKETLYDRELMTGFVEPGVRMPLSRLTIGALRDLGYGVNPDHAENYAISRRRFLRDTSARKKVGGCMDRLPPPVRIP